MGDTVSVPPLYGNVYDVPLDPVTLTDALFVSVTVNVTDCPDEILVELAVIETVGSDDDELVLTVIVV